MKRNKSPPKKSRSYDQSKKDKSIAKAAPKKSQSYDQSKGTAPKQPDNAITPVEYGGLQKAYDHFNKELFGGSLPDVFIVYSRRSHSKGHFAPNRFAGRGTNMPKHELSLNPDGFINRSDEQIVSTLVHEMVHHWQEHCSGKKRERYNYHDKEWAAKMKSIGLQPSNSGMVGGKETGVSMSHYILDGGPFQITYQKLATTGGKH
jgi:predicted SprT family Zn-dependent metalloprotease